MTGPRQIIPHALYDPQEAADALRIGRDKLDSLVAEGRIRPVDYTAKWRFWGEDLIALCRAAGGVS